MCDTCGCSSEGGAVLRKPGATEGYHVHIGEPAGHHHDHDHGHDHHHEHDHDHEHDHAHSHDGPSRKVAVEQDVLLKNNLLAERNRGWFEARKVLALNFLSSPGSGKTTILEKSLPMLGDWPVAVIEGDQQTTNDADRLHALGVPAIQVNTGTGCHLDALMVQRAIRELDLAERSLLCIENVGNLVCPAMFDLGESARVVVISVTEGEDKPLKYPTMFHHADVVLLNKIDLLPYVDFNPAVCREYASQVNSRLEWIELSARTGQGMDCWKAWVTSRLERL